MPSILNFLSANRITFFSWLFLSGIFFSPHRSLEQLINSERLLCISGVRRFLSLWSLTSLKHSCTVMTLPLIIYFSVTVRWFFHQLFLFSYFLSISLLMGMATYWNTMHLSKKWKVSVSVLNFIFQLLPLTSPEIPLKITIAKAKSLIKWLSANTNF